MHNKNNVKFICQTIKGTVSRDTRWGLLYIKRKLFSRRGVADDKILTFLKSHFTIYMKQLCDSIAEWYGFSKTILKCRKIISSVSSIYASSPFRGINMWMHGKTQRILEKFWFRSVNWSYATENSDWIHMRKILGYSIPAS